MKLTTIGDHDPSLAGLDLSSFKLVALDLSHVNDGLRRANVAPIAGVLGAGVLIRQCAVIDYARSCIVITRRSRRARAKT